MNIKHNVSLCCLNTSILKYGVKTVNNLNLHSEGIFLFVKKKHLNGKFHTGFSNILSSPPSCVWCGVMKCDNRLSCCEKLSQPGPGYCVQFIITGRSDEI